MEANWYDTKFRRVKVDQIVGWYDVWTGDLPFAKLTFKVSKDFAETFVAYPNAFFRGPDGIEYTLGSGSSVERAVLNGVESFYAEIHGRNSLTYSNRSKFIVQFAKSFRRNKDFSLL